MKEGTLAMMKGKVRECVRGSIEDSPTQDTQQK